MTSPASTRISESKVRRLDVADLGLDISNSDLGPSAADERIDDLGITDEDPIMLVALDLLETYGGVIFTGPPGTSKTWYAANIALKLTKGNPNLVRFVQFHPSYQYEDFVEGYVPIGHGGFSLRPKHLLQLCQLAEEQPPGEWVVLVIDELSRGDPGRIFGEALTYLEKTKRGLRFHLSSGTELSIPSNLALLATMNPLDRGVDEVDTAFERRFAKIPMDPSAQLLDQFLAEAGMDGTLRTRVMTFFRAANSRVRVNPYSAVGHTFFLGISNELGLKRVWDHQLRYLFEKAYRLDQEGLAEMHRAWARVLADSPTLSGQETTDGQDTASEPTVETP